MYVSDADRIPSAARLLMLERTDTAIEQAGGSDAWTIDEVTGPGIICTGQSDYGGASRSMNKVIGLSDVANFVQDGDVVLVHGFALGAKPLALLRELIRARKRT